jgi:hypothetical protein
VINKVIMQVVWERGGDGQRRREKGQEEEARGRERQGTYRTVQNRTVRKVKNGKEQRKQEEG